MTEIIPPHLAIKAMRSSGYRDTAHAVAELVDNSIQAGVGLQDCTTVEVASIDKEVLIRDRTRRRIHQIAVCDNACGMRPEVLRIALQFGNGTRLDPGDQTGIGKFGMGLPNASISQCKEVDVWSWRAGECYHTYLRVDDIVAGKLRDVPEPRQTDIPAIWKKRLSGTHAPHGTLVVWSQLDRVKWKSSRALFDNAEFLIGRIYRHFLAEERARIWFAAFEDGQDSPSRERWVLPNDPLFLMTGTSSPSPYNENPAFDAFGDTEEVTVVFGGQEHQVSLRYSFTKTGPRRDGGSSAIGRYAARNQGVSIVRAGRELEVNRTFENRHDPRERWWGIEVSFEPALDDVFGVTNNKQAATHFMKLDIDEDAKAEGMSAGEYREQLQQHEDPRWVMYEISARIGAQLRTMREQIKRMKEGASKGKKGMAAGSAESLGTRAIKKRREQLGGEPLSQSDKDESLPEGDRVKLLKDDLVAHGDAEPEEAEELAVQFVRPNLKFLFVDGAFPGQAFFDVRTKAGTIIVSVNTRHPAHEHLYTLLQDDADGPALRGLKLLLSAWARLEDEAGAAKRQDYEDMRFEWGRMARDFLQEIDE